MFKKDNYVIYTTDSYVILYNKLSKEVTELSNNMYRLLVQFSEGTVSPSKSVVESWKTHGLLSDSQEENKNQKQKSFYGLDKRIPRNTVFKIIEFICIYFSFPAWATMFIIFRGEIFAFFGGLQLKDLFYIPFVFLFFIFGLVSHELFHMIVAVNKGIFVPELSIGVKKALFYGYTRIIGIEKIEKREKLKIYYAGIAMNYLCSAASLMLFSVLQNRICLLSAIVFMFQAFINSSVFNNGDGYNIVLILFDDIELPSKISPEFMRNNLRIKRWLATFPVMNIFGLVILPFILIIHRIIYFHYSFISIKSFLIILISTVFLCFVLCLFIKDNKTLLVISAISSMILTLGTAMVSFDKILLNTPVFIVFAIPMLPAIESVYFLAIAIYIHMIEYAKKNHFRVI